MTRLFASSTSSKSEAATTLSSTLDWRQWWSAESQRVGTDWPTLARQHIGALSVVLAHCSRGPSP
jgi:hypothetical protein